MINELVQAKSCRTGSQHCWSCVIVKESFSSWLDSLDVNIWRDCRFDLGCELGKLGARLVFWCFFNVNRFLSATLILFIR